MIKCQYENCNQPGKLYEYPEVAGLEYPDGSKTVYLCSKHAPTVGFCLSCGGFYGGLESFDFDGCPGFCENCEASLGLKEGFDY